MPAVERYFVSDLFTLLKFLDFSEHRKEGGYLGPAYLGWFAQVRANPNKLLLPSSPPTQESGSFS